MEHIQETRQFGFERLDVWHVVLDAVAQSAVVADALPPRDRDLADQIRRSSRSIAANLAEGLGKSGKDRVRFHSYALGSAYETAAHIEVASRLHLIDGTTHLSLRSLLLRAVSMLTRMTR